MLPEQTFGKPAGPATPLEDRGSVFKVGMRHQMFKCSSFIELRVLPRSEPIIKALGILWTELVSRALATRSLAFWKGLLTLYGRDNVGDIRQSRRLDPSQEVLTARPYQCAMHTHVELSKRAANNIDFGTELLSQRFGQGQRPVPIPPADGTVFDAHVHSA